MLSLHLERIEMSGFKSFADKTVIEFDEGVTAVVGPNGSGKSNLSEAVRWVLGEQSAKNLRGKKMDDIVFAGSQTRKPVNIAEVTLVLNNEDGFLPLEFSEVSITRRYNRNGDSDCFINKKPCRLKDITELLMDSGIGKDSFSMISQGKVEQIFQNKPEDRRTIFEEAAGVAKYKNRKKSAESKLSQTEEHLNRVEDILHEINGQLVPLKKQRNTALEYREKKQTLSAVEIALTAAEITSLNGQWQRSKQNLGEYNREIEAAEEQLALSQKELAALKDRMDRCDEELEVLQNRYVTVVQKLEQLEGQKKIFEQRAEYSSKNHEEQALIIQTKEALIREETAKLKQLEAELATKLALKKELSQQRVVLFEKESQLSQDKTQLVQHLRNSYIDKLQEQSSNKNTVTYLEKETLLASEQEYRFLSKSDELTRTVRELKERTVTVTAEHAQFVQANERLTTELQTRKQEQFQIVAALQKMNAELDTVTRTLQQAQARRESQQELDDSYASYYQGVKEILRRRTAVPGILGSVAELIQVPERYTLAMEIALGATVQHVVVADEKTASQCIGILKAQHLGRATFLPLNVIQGKSLPQNVRETLEGSAGYLGVANEMINYDGAYTNIISSLLGTTIVAENLQTGLQLSKKLYNRYRIVSLEGDVIHAGGSMTGGATKRQQESSLLARKNNLKKMAEYIEQLSSQHRQLKKEQEKAVMQQQAIQEELEAKRQEATIKQFELQQKEAILKQVTADIGAKEKELAAHDYEKRLFFQEKEERQAQLKEVTQKLAILDDEIKVLQKDMEESNLNEEERLKLLREVQQKRQQADQELAVLQEQEKQLKRDVKISAELIRSEKTAIQDLKGKQDQEAKLADTQSMTIQEIVAQLQTTEEAKMQTDGALKQLREKKKAMEHERASKEEGLNEINKSLQNLWSEQAKLEANSSRFEIAIDHHLEHLSEEYGLSYEAAKEQYALSVSVEEAAIQVKTLKKAIDGLGPINLGAIDEYERIAERFDFLTAQQTDLLTARGNLLNTMNEMDDEVRARFQEMFQLIKKQFEKTFPKLFGGGKATLELTDPTDLLETGIEIVAQPPGKRLQQLSLLSGGEKAFTAIALLFAIIEVKPVPFCILDEVEAALDEANVSRFGKYLAASTDLTQFIVITHRKGTMEEADVLYGVTMQDSGVSRLASVKFEDYEEA
jgi:chromosome segregation protein|nr:chromosome segregation protein SMC [Trichococcus palustris]